MFSKIQILSKGDLDIFIGNVLSLAFVKTVLLQFLHLLFGDNSSIAVFVYGAIFTYLSWGIVHFQILKIKNVSIWLAFLSFFLINYAFTSSALKEYYVSIDMILTYLFYIPIAVFLIPLIQDVYKVLSQISIFRIIVIIIAAYMIFARDYASYEHETYMSFSYAVMPYVILCFYEGCFRGKYFDYFAYALGVVVMAFYGARTPLVSSLAAAALMYIVYIRKEKNTVSKILTYIIILAATSFFIIYGNVILEWIGRIGENIDSYALSKLNRDVFLESSTRGKIYERAINLIKAQGIFPMGLFADRYYLNVIYVHNIFLEILINFGVLAGGILSILLLLGISRSITVSKDESVKVFLIFSFFAIFARFILSGTYLAEGMSFVYFAIIYKFSH